MLFLSLFQVRTEYFVVVFVPVPSQDREHIVVVFVPVPSQDREHIVVVFVPVPSQDRAYRCCFCASGQSSKSGQSISLLFLCLFQVRTQSMSLLFLCLFQVRTEYFVVVFVPVPSQDTEYVMVVFVFLSLIFVALLVITIYTFFSCSLLVKLDI